MDNRVGPSLKRTNGIHPFQQLAITIQDLIGSQIDDAVDELVFVRKVTVKLGFARPACRSHIVERDRVDAPHIEEFGSGQNNAVSGDGTARSQASLL